MIDDKQQKLYLLKLGNKIRKRRFDMDMSQEEIALGIECNTSHFSEIERGKVNPSYIMIIRLAKALLISPKDLMPE